MQQDDERSARCRRRTSGAAITTQNQPVRESLEITSNAEDGLCTYLPGFIVDMPSRLVADAVVVVPSKLDLLGRGVTRERLQVREERGIDVDPACRVVKRGAAGGLDREAVARLPAVVDPRVVVPKLHQGHRRLGAGETCWTVADGPLGRERVHLTTDQGVGDSALEEVPATPAQRRCDPRQPPTRSRSAVVSAWRGVL